MTTPYTKAPENLQLTKSGQYEIDDQNRIWDTKTGGQLDEAKAFGELGLNTNFLPKKGAVIPENPNSPMNYLSNVKQEDPITKFNFAMLDMLSKAQGAGGNVELFKQQRALQRKSLDITSAPTPEELKVLSPSQQSAIRSGSAQALEPEIDAIASEIKARDSRLSNFERILGDVRQIGGDIAKNIAPPKEVLEGYKFMIRAGTDPTSIPAEVRNKVMGGMTPEDWTAWKDSNTKAKLAGSGNSNQMTDNERALMGQFRGESIVKSYNEILAKTQTIQKIVNNGLPNGPSDLAVVFAFMKSLDPNSVVRESEYATAANSGSPFYSIAVKMKGYADKGQFLPDAVKQEFSKIAGIQLEIATNQYDNVAQEYRDIATRQNLNPDNVVIKYSNAANDPKLPKDKKEAQPMLEEDITSLGETMTREKLADELFKDYGKWYTRDEIYKKVLSIIPDKPQPESNSNFSPYVGGGYGVSSVTNFLRK